MDYRQRDRGDIRQSVKVTEDREMRLRDETEKKREKETSRRQTLRATKSFPRSRDRLLP